jgi:hypothetical protein
MLFNRILGQLFLIQETCDGRAARLRNLDSFQAVCVRSSGFCKTNIGGAHDNACLFGLSDFQTSNVNRLALNHITQLLA